MITILKGNIISAPSFGALDIYENSYLVADDGIITGIFEDLPKEYLNNEVIDYSNKLIFEAFSDMHLHAPQYPMLGMGFDLELIDWLNIYTYPLESKFKSTEYAREIYSKLAKELVKNGTTRVAMFSSIHVDSTLILMEELEKAGISGYVGKVNMDRNASKELTEDTQESINETIRWIKESKRFKNIKPIITPRFTPSCSDELMEGLGRITKEYNLPVQSHISENKKEIEWVKELTKDDYYFESYKKYGLWNNKTLMAHAIHSSKEEYEAFKKDGVYVVHCPSSNVNVLSGIAPVRRMVNMGVKVVLGSDIAGGDNISMFECIKESIKTSKYKEIIDKDDFLTEEEVYYLASSASAPFFNEKEGITKGNTLNVIVLDDSKLSSPHEMTIKERFKRAMYLREEGAIIAVYNGRRIF